MDYLTSFYKNSSNIILSTSLHFASEEVFYSGSDIVDDCGITVEDISMVDMLCRLYKVEGDILTINAMNKINIGTELEDADDFADLTVNQVAILNFALALGDAVRFGYYEHFDNKLVYHAIGSILVAANSLFTDYANKRLFLETFCRAANICNDTYLCEKFGI